MYNKEVEIADLNNDIKINFLELNNQVKKITFMSKKDKENKNKLKHSKSSIIVGKKYSHTKIKNDIQHNKQKLVDNIEGIKFLK